MAMNKEIDEAIAALLTYRNLVLYEEDKAQVEELIKNLKGSIR